MFQKNPERRRTGMDRRNLGSMNDEILDIPDIWMAHRVITYASIPTIK